MPIIVFAFGCCWLAWVLTHRDGYLSSFARLGDLALYVWGPFYTRLPGAIVTAVLYLVSFSYSISRLREELD